MDWQILSALCSSYQSVNTLHPTSAQPISISYKLCSVKRRNYIESRRPGIKMQCVLQVLYSRKDAHLCPHGPQRASRAPVLGPLGLAWSDHQSR